LPPLRTHPHAAEVRHKLPFELLRERRPLHPGKKFNLRTHPFAASMSALIPV